VNLGLVTSLVLASIPRHIAHVPNLIDEADVLLRPSPRASLLNSQYSNHHNSTLQYRYEKAGAVTNMVYPGNQTVTYTWDQGRRLASVKDRANRTWNFSYDGASRLSGIQYPNGVNYSRGYNADGQLTNYVHSKSGTPFISRTFERNSAGLKMREVISAGLEVEQPDTWQKHTSDKADRLTGLTRRDEYVLPENWRGYTPSYNQEGQVTNVTEGYKAWSSDNNLIWDAAGRLVEYTGLRQTNLWTDLPPLPSWGLNLAYDGLGARTVRTDELVSHRLVVDRVGRLKLPLMETDSENTAIRYYIWAPGIGLLAQIEASGTIHYFHADENGSTLAMTDSSGNVTDQFAYSPWGELLGRTGTNTTSFTFIGGGGVTWEGGALYKMGARYYDARLKRWLSSDPIGMAGGANLYLYCNGNPLYWVDVLGMCGEAWYQRDIIPGSSLVDMGMYASQGAHGLLRSPYDLAVGAYAGAQGVGTYFGNLSADPAGTWNSTVNTIDSLPQTVPAALNRWANDPQAIGSTAGQIGIGVGLAKMFSAGSAAGNGTTLYRAVGPSELADIQASNVLRNFGSAEGKYFTTSPEAASSYARQAVQGFGDPSYTLIQARVPNSIFEGLTPATVDRGIPAWVIPNSRLTGLTPQVLNAMPIPHP
jgi:RHS repeat-associated protein